jgi:hypothetical protein
MTSKNEYQDTPGGKDSRCVRVTTFTTLIVTKLMKNPEALTFRITKGLFRPVAEKLYLYICDEKSALLVARGILFIWCTILNI